MVESPSPDLPARAKALAGHFLDGPPGAGPLPPPEDVPLTRAEFADELEDVRNEFAGALVALRADFATTRAALLAAIAQVQENQIESRFDSADLQAGQVESKVDQAELSADSAELLSDQVELLGGLTELQQGQAALQESVDTIRAVLGAMQAASGPALASLVLRLMHGTLLLANVDPNAVHREPLVDHAGLLFPLGHAVEVGVLRVDGSDYLVDAQQAADDRTIYHFAQVGRLYEQETGRPPAGLLLVALRVSSRNLALAQQAYLMWVVAGEVVDE